MIRNTIILLVVLAAAYGILMSIPDARAFYEMYLFDRTAFRLESLPTVQRRTYTAERLLMELIPLIGLTLIMAILFRKKVRFKQRFDRYSALFLFIGISGTLPLMTTHIQKGFYMTPAMPFFALGFAALLTPYAEQLKIFASAHSSKMRIVGRIVVAVLFIGVAIQCFSLNTPNRDKDLLGDLKVLSPWFEKEVVIYSPNAMWGNWAMQTYLMRYYGKHMNSGFSGRTVIVDRKKSHTVPPEYAKVPVKTVRYDLYQRKTP